MLSISHLLAATGCARSTLAVGTECREGWHRLQRHEASMGRRSARPERFTRRRCQRWGHLDGVAGSHGPLGGAGGDRCAVASSASWSIPATTGSVDVAVAAVEGLRTSAPRMLSMSLLAWEALAPMAADALEGGASESDHPAGTHTQ
jgi:hypothetical protein